MSANRVLRLTGRGELRLYDNDDKYVALKSAADLADNLTFIFPADAGTAGYQLATDGAGNLTWVPPGGSEEFAQVIILGQGPLELQDSAGGEFVRIRAPGTVANSYTLTLPDDLPPSTKFLAVSDAGVVSYTDGASTLQTAYDAGAEIVLDATGPVIITNDEDQVALQIGVGATSTAAALSLTNAGAGTGLLVDQTGDAPALDLTKTAGTEAAAQVTGVGAISGSILKLTAPAAGSAIGLEVVGDGSGIGLRVSQGTTAAIAAQLNQATDAICLDLNKTGAGAGNALDIDNDGTGVGLNVKQDGAAIGLVVTQATANAAAQLNQAGNAIALDVNKTGAGSGAAVDIDNDGTGVGLNLRQDGAAVAALITQNGAGTALSVAQTQNQIGLSVVKTGSGAGSAAYVENDGTGFGLQVVQDGDAVAASIAAASASGEAVLQLTHGSSDPLPDVQGTSATWSVTNKGSAAFKRVASAAQTYTIASGAITLNGGGFASIAGEGGVGDNLDTISSDSGSPVLAGTSIVLRAADDADTIVVRSGIDNIRLNAGGNRTLDNVDDTLTLIFDGTNWLETAFSSNGG